MTDEACIAFCQSNNMYWAGTEYSTQCFCGNALNGGGGPAANQGDCDMACSGMMPHFAVFNFSNALQAIPPRLAVVPTG